MEPTIVEIEVTQSADGLRVAPIVHRGATVIWTFKGELAGKKLKVRNKDDHSIIFDTGSGPQDQIRGLPFPLGGTESSFRYEIIEVVNGEDKKLDWADGPNGGCMKNPDPP